MTDKVIFKKIRPVLEFVANNPYSSFYKNKYKKAGISLLKNINSLEDFKKLPFLTRGELMETDPYDRFFFPKTSVRGSIHSSSTTGETSVLIMLKTNNNRGNKSAVKKALDLKIKSAMVLTYPTALWAIQNRTPFKHKSIIRYSGNIYNLENSAKMIKQLRIDALATTSSILEKITPYLKQEDVLDQIRFITLGGETCPRPRWDYLKSSFKKAFIRFAYTSVEAGGIGRQCDYLSQAFPVIFHPIPRLFFEIINPKNESELVLSSLLRTEFPLIRYKTGDMVKVYKEKCPCGKNVKMKVTGRLNSDVIKVKDIYLEREQIDGALYGFGKYLNSSNWRALISGSKAKNQLPLIRLQLILLKKDKDGKIKRLLAKGISDNIKFPTGKTFADLVKEKGFLPMEIEFVDSFNFALKQKPFSYVPS